MRASYHTHTYRCKHASGSAEEYIERGIAEGLSILGFSDHAPMPYKYGYVSSYKMLPEEIGEYFDELVALKEKYKSKIDIKIGFETEYYPSLWEDSLRFWKSYPVDYLILGQHFVPEEYFPDRVYSGNPTSEKQNVTTYVDRVIAGMNTGIITYVAHPDLINYTGKDNVFYLDEMSRIIEEAKRLAMPIEYNLLGKALGRNYPNRDFWNLAADYKVDVIIGCDSHSPDRVAKKDEIENAEKYLFSLGFNVLDEIELKKVLF